MCVNQDKKIILVAFAYCWDNFLFLNKVIHIAHALVADEGGKPGFEEVKEEEEEEHCTSTGFDVAVHRSVWRHGWWNNDHGDDHGGDDDGDDHGDDDGDNDGDDHGDNDDDESDGRVESSSEGDEVASIGKKGLTAPVLNLDCFHTGIS